MTLDEFKIGGEFQCGGHIWRCTDIGTRVVVAVRLDDIVVFDSKHKSSKTLTRAEAEASGWFNGPPYAVAEHTFDEYDQPGCHQ